MSQATQTKIKTTMERPIVETESGQQYFMRKSDGLQRIVTSDRAKPNQSLVGMLWSVLTRK